MSAYSLIGVIIIALVHASPALTRCPAPAIAPLPFVLEYALWRGWHQALIYAPDMEQGCQWVIIRLIKCFGINGIASMANPLANARVRSKLGIVILSPHLKQNATEELSKLIKKLHENKMGATFHDWLIATRSDSDIKYINKILNATSIKFDENIVVAYPHKNHNGKIFTSLCDNNFIYGKPERRGDNRPRVGHRAEQIYSDNCRNNGYKNGNCHKTNYEINYYRASERFRNLTRFRNYKKSGSALPLFQSGILIYNYSRTFKMVNISRFSLRVQYNKWSRVNNFVQNLGIIKIDVIQYFKVRINSTLYAYFLGLWTHENSMSGIEPLYPVEIRNFLGEEMIVGRCNSTGDGTLSLDDDGPAAPGLLDDVLHFLTVRLNTTSTSRYYNKLGFRTYEGTWTGLLGALMETSVDLALEPVTAHATRHYDMDFIFPIAETMCNIYIRHQETSTVRDIFLAPFSGRLVACVVAVALVAAIVVVLISKLAPTIPNEERSMDYAEAFIWSTGILCQQGGTWTPPNPSASVLLIFCLFFGLVTYNAYAAFITSVLSVRVASVDTVAAVLHSPNFKIGYIRNGADQMYLMSTKDAQLNAFYIRGYSNAENLVSSAEEGLARAAKQDYAFFAGQRAARSTLRSLSQARGRCAVRELLVPSTRADLAFPLPHQSPYARPILVSLLQMRSGGALARLEAALVPDMPQCAPPPGFASARAADVRSALLLLTIGLISALLLGKYTHTRVCMMTSAYMDVGRVGTSRVVYRQDDNQYKIQYNTKQSIYIDNTQSII